MGIGIVFEAIVPVLAVGFLRSQFLEPNVKVVVQTRFIVVDKHRGRDVHRIYQDQPLLYTTFHKAALYLGCNVDQFPSSGDVEPEFLAV